MSKPCVEALGRRVILSAHAEAVSYLHRGAESQGADRSRPTGEVSSGSWASVVGRVTDGAGTVIKQVCGVDITMRKASFVKYWTPPHTHTSSVVYAFTGLPRLKAAALADRASKTTLRRISTVVYNA